MLKNINNIKDLSLDSMFNRMRMYHKKFTSLNNLTPRTENKEKLKQEVLNNAGDIYNELYYIYKNKYNKKINSLSTKKRIKLDYKKLKLADIYYLSDEEQKQKQEEKQKEKQEEKQKETKDDAIALEKWIINEEENINKELFKKYFLFQTPSELLKDLSKTNDKDKKVN